MVTIEFMKKGRGRERGSVHFLLVPFDVDVAHPLPGDADVVQDDVTGVPDDAPQEKPEEEQILSL